MKQLSRLREVTLQHSSKVRQPNGTNLTTYQDVETYDVIVQELTDSVNATIYGANIFKMLRLSSPLLDLEKYLRAKNTDTADNLSNYFITLDGKRYRIVKSYNNWVDIEFIETVRANTSR